jgi:hypothetical protein
VDPTGLMKEEITYSTTVTVVHGEGYTEYITEMNSLTVEQGLIYKFYYYNTCRIEVIKILDTPEGKKYANSLNREENLKKQEFNVIITGIGVVCENHFVTAFGIGKVLIDYNEAATDSGAAKYEAGDTIIKYTIETTTARPAGCRASYIKKEIIIIFDKFGNIKTSISRTDSS